MQASALVQYLLMLLDSSDLIGASSNSVAHQNLFTVSPHSFFESLEHVTSTNAAMQKACFVYTYVINLILSTRLYVSVA